MITFVVPVCEGLIWSDETLHTTKKEKDGLFFPSLNNSVSLFIAVNSLSVPEHL